MPILRATVARIRSSSVSWTLSWCHQSAHQPRSQFSCSPEWFPDSIREHFVVVLHPCGPPPQFEQRVNRRIKWSLVWQQSTSAWDLQWMCVSCCRTVPAGDMPNCPTSAVWTCGVPSHMVVGCRPNERWSWCTGCQTRAESSPQQSHRSWFSHGPLANLGPYGWGDHSITVPGQGPP